LIWRKSAGGGGEVPTSSSVFDGTRRESGNMQCCHTLAGWQASSVARSTQPPRITQQGNGNMGLFSKDIQSMDDLFVHTLRDIYYAEKQIVKALPEMIEKAHDPQLKQGFQSHLRET
jgi:hypothetical protein